MPVDVVRLQVACCRPPLLVCWLALVLQHDAHIRPHQTGSANSSLLAALEGCWQPMRGRRSGWGGSTPVRAAATASQRRSNIVHPSSFTFLIKQARSSSQRHAATSEFKNGDRRSKNPHSFFTRFSSSLTCRIL